MVREFKKWETNQYLSHYYGSLKLPPDEVIIFRFIRSFLKREKINAKSVLDFGSGPTIHRVVPFVPFVKRIYFADYLSQNLNSIKSWKTQKGDAHNWDGQIKHILRIENHDSKKKFNQRIKELKTKISGLLECDIFKKNPLGLKKQFPIVLSFYCADSITSSKLRWGNAMHNLCSLVEPKGWIIISALRNTSHYKVGTHYFPSPNVNEKDFIRVLHSNNFKKNSIHAKIIPCPQWQKDGIKSLLVLVAQKNETN